MCDDTATTLAAQEVDETGLRIAAPYLAYLAGQHLLARNGGDFVGFVIELAELPEVARVLIVAALEDSAAIAAPLIAEHLLREHNPTKEGENKP